MTVQVGRRVYTVNCQPYVRLVVTLTLCENEGATANTVAILLSCFQFENSCSSAGCLGFLSYVCICLCLSHLMISIPQAHHLSNTHSFFCNESYSKWKPEALRSTWFRYSKETLVYRIRFSISEVFKLKSSQENTITIR